MADCLLDTIELTGDIALIGAGVMGEALASALVRRLAFDARRICVSDVRSERLESIRKSLGVRISTSNKAAIAGASVVLLAVKPQTLSAVLSELSTKVRRDQLIISIAAGIPTSVLESQLGEDVRVIRAMPNTPGLVGMGITAVCKGRHASPDDLQTAAVLLGSMGEVVQVDESQMDAVTGLSGSGPAYCLMFIESLAEAGVLNGLARDVALKLSYWTVMGAAALAKDTGEHPAVLKSRVTSPAGTTAAALSVLERRGLRSAVIDAVTVAADRSKQLSGRDS